MKKVRFITIGCRVNQYETQGMREALRRTGGDPQTQAQSRREDGIDFVVINTCTVTSKADRENRYWIRRAHREHPQAKIIVTGCGIERDFKNIQSMPEVDLVLANKDKADIASKLEMSCANPESNVGAYSNTPLRSKHEYAPLFISESEGKTRAFVKIQDGCNHACSFCKVVLVRGRSRSRKLQDIVDEVCRLRDSGYRDIVFVGIQLGAYGLDFSKSKQPKIVDVLYACSKIEGIERLRLSSIEPTDVEDSLIEALSQIPQCSHHLHIPLQSGDDAVLKRMNRRYNRQFYRDLVKKLKNTMPDFCLTLDVMAGFPGEAEENFQNTVRLLEEVRPLKCHVFPYSAREGTQAYRLYENEVVESTKKERVQILMALSDRLGREVRLSNIGRVMNILVENTKGTVGGTKKPLLRGLTSNFMRVAFANSRARVGEVVPVELLSVQQDVILGREASKEGLTL